MGSQRMTSRAGKVFLVFSVSCGCALFFAAYEWILVRRMWADNVQELFVPILQYYLFTLLFLPLLVLLLGWLIGKFKPVHPSVLATSLVVVTYVYLFLGMLVNMHSFPRISSPASIVFNIAFSGFTLFFLWTLYRFGVTRSFLRSGLWFATIVLVAVLFYLPVFEVGALSTVELGESAEADSDAPNIIIVLIDALRADHVSAYGYEKKTTPNIDAYAKEGVLFMRAYSQSNWTLPSVASIFTSLIPESHGAFSVRDGLPHGQPVLTEILRHRGYRTGLFSDNPNVSEELGYGRGADMIYQPRAVELRTVLGIANFSEQLPILRRVLTPVVPETKGLPGNWQIEDDRLVLENAYAFLSDDSNRPYFVYAHIVSPHSTYDPPERERELFCPQCPDAETVNKRLESETSRPGLSAEHVIGLYDGEIHYSDRIVGDFLKRALDFENERSTIVVITSDHGESFFEHGSIGHGNNLYEEEIKVPLIFHYPPVIEQGRRIDLPVRSIDILPTLLELAGFEHQGYLQGRSLVPMLARGSGLNPKDGVPVVSQFGQEYYCLIDGRYKLVKKLIPDREFELYDLESDALETQSLEDGELLASIDEKLENCLELAPRVGHSNEVTLTDSQKERLKALGYIQ